MQRVMRTGSHRCGGNATVCRQRKILVSGASGIASASGVKTLAPAFAQALPSLKGVRADYTYEANRERLYEFCAALVREKLGNPDSWKQAGGNAIRFAQSVISNGIGAERDQLLDRNVEYHLLVTDALERYGEDAQLDSGKLAVLIECGGSGYLKIGSAIEAMEAEAEGLGAAFYWTLTHSLYRVMRLYNHDDAMMYEEQLRDYAAEDDEKNRDQYEFPEVEKALPECIRKTLKRDYHAGKAQDRTLLRRYRKGRFGTWIDRLRSSNRGNISKTATTISRHCRACSFASRNRMPSWPVSTKRASRCLNRRRNLRSAPSSLRPIQMKCAMHCGS